MIKVREALELINKNTKIRIIFCGPERTTKTDVMTIGDVKYDWLELEVRWIRPITAEWMDLLVDGEEPQNDLSEC